MNNNYYVYIVTNEHGNVLYVGVTNNLQRRMYEHKQMTLDGFTKKYKVLLPFCWVYLPARYIVRSFLGLRPKKNVLSAVGASNKRYSLYKKLHLYEVK